jgi:NAD(P)-dependent dehydrogenase (short-subunit alcohol dehydrogenase family)
LLIMPQTPQNLAGRVAVVTGGAQGIGRAIVEAFLSEGAAVGVIDGNEAALSQTVSELRAGDGPPVEPVTADVTDEISVREGLRAIRSSLGPVGILVNDAAIFTLGGIEVSHQDWLRCLDVNVVGYALMAREIVPFMKENGGGTIINIGSVSGFIAQKGFLAYNVSKAAVAGLTRCLALELWEFGIRVNSVCPGAVWSTPEQQLAREHGFTKEDAGGMPNMGLEAIIKRPAEPAEIARAVVFMASDDSSFVTGSNMMVDGGWTAL